jgi:hypothetical protein
MGDCSNNEYQESQILPAPSEVEHYQIEEKCHLIAFASLFRHSGCQNGPELRFSRNHGQNTFQVVALLHHEGMTWRNRSKASVFESRYSSSLVLVSESLMLPT